MSGRVHVRENVRALICKMLREKKNTKQKSRQLESVWSRLSFISLGGSLIKGSDNQSCACMCVCVCAARQEVCLWVSLCSRRSQRQRNEVTDGAAFTRELPNSSSSSPLLSSHLRPEKKRRSHAASRREAIKRQAGGRARERAWGSASTLDLCATFLLSAPFHPLPTITAELAE